MKNYFKFNLTGNKVFPVWILFFVLYIIPYSIIQYKMQTLSKVQTTDLADTMQRMASLFKMYGVSGILIIVEYSIMFFIYKMSIDGIEFKEKTFSFVGKFGSFIGLFISNLLLTIITFGIYGPWFLTKMYRFFAANSKYDDKNPEFKGKGSDLFVVILVTLIIPICVAMAIFMISAFIGGFITAMKNANPSEMSPVMWISASGLFIVMLLIMLPFIYYYYKWIVNFTFRGYEIKWETEFWNSALQIFVQMGLSIITLGIYAPVGTLRLYKYFAEKTLAKSETGMKRFGYDLEAGNDFLYIWGQLLICAITIGIYFPWAYCKIANRILGKTFVEG
ncbi:MAG: DUF898 family protein [Paludibacter sp.]